MSWIFFLFKKEFRLGSKKSIRWVFFLALLGVALGVGTLTLTQAVLSGFERVFRESIFEFNAHIVLLRDGEMQAPQADAERVLALSHDEVEAWTPFLHREGLAVAHGRVKGLALKGIDPLTFQQVYGVRVRPLGQAQVPANIGNLLKGSSDLPSLLLGADLAEELGVKNAGETLKVFLPTPQNQKSKTGPHFQTFRVEGTFATGLYEFDHGFALTDLKRLQEIFSNPGAATGIEFRLKNPEAAEEIAARWKKAMSYPYDAISWQKLNGPFFKALRLERTVFFVVMSMVVLVATFNIIGVLLLMIFDKSREISILRAMGASRLGLQRLFGLQGLSIAILGSLLGLGLGLSIAWVLKNSSLLTLPAEVYLVHRLPVDISGSVMLLVIVVSLAISILSTRIAVSRLNHSPLDL